MRERGSAEQLMGFADNFLLDANGNGKIRRRICINWTILLARQGEFQAAGLNAVRGRFSEWF